MTNHRNHLQINFRQKLYRYVVLFVVAIACSWFFNANQSSWGQSPSPLEWLTGGQLTLNANSNANNDIASIDSAPIQLDGYQLFFLAGPSVNQSFPLKQRVKGIEEELNSLANSNLDPKALQVESNLDPESNQPIITIDGRYLMTVTNLDAQIQGRNPQGWAKQLTQILRDALIRARQERQPKFLLDRTLWAVAIILGMTITNQVITQRKRHLKSHQLEAKSQVDHESNPNPETDDVERLQQRVFFQKHINIYKLQRRILQAGQILILGGGSFLILGLFPYTRWLQFFLLSTPLKLLGLGFGSYGLIRLSNLVVDYFSELIKARDFYLLKSFQRLELRVYTASQVLKNVLAIIWGSLAILTGLSVIGVDLIPLLAGAGIVGLAISFAAQGLIKDVINGFLIILEDQYAVGDVIVVGALGGFVENMNLRITQIRNDEGQLITIPNSSISIVQNLSKDWSRVNLTIEISYDTHPDHALSVLEQLAKDIYYESFWRNKILEPPKVLGIDELRHSGMLIRIWIKTQPLEQWAVAREFRRRLQMIMQAENIAIGIPHQFLYLQNLQEPLNFTQGFTQDFTQGSLETKAEASES